MKTLPSLDHHCGSDTFYRNSLMRNFLYTAGIQDLSEQCGAYWLIDLVASHQSKPAVRQELFQLWEIRATPDSDESVAVVRCLRDAGGPLLSWQYLEYTDFPLDQPFSWYVCNNEHGGKTMMLKSEY